MLTTENRVLPTNVVYGGLLRLGFLRRARRFDTRTAMANSGDKSFEVQSLALVTSSLRGTLQVAVVPASFVGQNSDLPHDSPSARSNIIPTQAVDFIVLAATIEAFA